LVYCGSLCFVRNGGSGIDGYLHGGVNNMSDNMSDKMSDNEEIKPLCCLVKNATPDQLDRIAKILSDNPNKIIHDENIFLYYPSDEACHNVESCKSAEYELKKKYIIGAISSEEYTEKMARL